MTSTLFYNRFIIIDVIELQEDESSSSARRENVIDSAGVLKIDITSIGVDCSVIAFDGPLEIRSQFPPYIQFISMLQPVAL